MRAVELDYTYSANKDGGATLHVSQLPPNTAIVAPGPAWLYVTVNGVPSVGVSVMLGSGQIEDQTVSAPESLPESEDIDATPDAGNSNTGKNGANGRATFQLATGILATVFACFVLWA